MSVATPAQTPIDPTLEEFAQQSLVAFAGYVDPTWVAYPHARAIAEALEDVESGATPKLIISVPAQHGKSSLASKCFPVWYLGRHPDAAIILASYGADFAELWGRRARDLMREFGPRLFGLEIRRGADKAGDWEVYPSHGTMHTAGVGGPVTGHSAELAIIDDPIKTREEAESPTHREKQVEWYKSSVVSRRPKKQVLIMTRWVEGDLAGWLQKIEPGEWRVLELPALAEANDVLGRAPGEALCPAFLDRAALLKIQRTVGSYVWSSMWRQKPTPLGGGLFKRDAGTRYTLRDGVYRHPDGSAWRRENMRLFVCVDTATTEDESNDQTAIAVFGATHSNRHLVLVDLVLEWIDGPKIMQRIREVCARYRCLSWIEDNSTSKHLLSFMRKERVPFKTVEAGTRDKFTRALPLSALWEDGRFLIPTDAAWLDAFEDQFFRFTGRDDDKDDAVDACAYGGRVFLEEFGRQFVTVPTGDAAPDELEGLGPSVGRGDPLAGIHLRAKRRSDEDDDR